MTVTQYQQHDFHWDEALGDPEGDVLDINTRTGAYGWHARAMREANERAFYQPIVICRVCKVNWAPREYGHCYVKPECRAWRMK